MGEAFTPERRLLNPAQYRRVFQQAQRSQDQALTLLYRANYESMARLGLAISKKSARRAVDRNRIKRLVRESFRQQDLPKVDIVVMCRPAILSWDNQRILRALEKHWQRLRTSCEASSSDSLKSTNT